MPKKRRKNESIHHPARLKLALTIISLAVFVGVLSLISQVFVINTIHCQLSSGEQCSTEIQAAFAPLKNSSIFFLNLESFVDQELAPKHPISLAKYDIFLPDRLDVMLDVETPVYQLVVVPNSEQLDQPTGSDQLNTVSQTGLVFRFENQTDRNLPMIYLSAESVDQDQQPQFAVHQVLLKIIQLAHQLNLNLEQIKWHDELTIELKLTDYQEYFMIDSLETNQQLNQLSILINSPEYQAIDVQKQNVDLRFELPVLRTSP